MNLATGITTVLAVLIIAAFVVIYVQNGRVPELGVENGKFKPLSEKPNGVSTQAQDAGKRVDPLPMKDSAEQTMRALKETVQRYGGAEIKQQSDDYLYVVFTTSLMKYHDDAEFWLNPATRQVEFRSASRAGRSDLGLNRERYQKLTELYQQH